MSKKYVFIRMRREDYERMIDTKKIPMERELRQMVGKKIVIKNTQLMNIAANSVWDLGSNFQSKMIKAIRVKKGGLKL